MQGRRREIEGGGVNALEGGVFNTVKTLKFEKLGVRMTPALLLRWRRACSHVPNAKFAFIV